MRFGTKAEAYAFLEKAIALAGPGWGHRLKRRRGCYEAYLVFLTGPGAITLDCNGPPWNTWTASIWRRPPAFGSTQQPITWARAARPKTAVNLLLRRARKNGADYADFAMSHLVDMEPYSPLREALTVICFAVPPPFVTGDDTSGLTDSQKEELQNWCGQHARPEWATALSILDAAEAMVRDAYDNANLRK